MSPPAAASRPRRAGLHRATARGGKLRSPADSIAATAGGSYVDEMRQIDFETEAQVLEIGLRRPPPSIEGQFQFGDEVSTSLDCGVNAERVDHL
jgi:hypothetical protein